MKRDNRLWERYVSLPIRVKLICAVTFTSLLLFTANLVLYANINSAIGRIDKVYTTNVSLNRLSQVLGGVQDKMYEYLNTRSSQALEDYYRYDQDYRAMLEGLNGTTSDNDAKLMEKAIRNLSYAYLDVTDDTVQAKRGQNLEKYKINYEKATHLLEYINAYIYSLNNERFKNNSDKYSVLRLSLSYLEIIATIILFAVAFFNVLLLTVITRSITKPLVDLAAKANEVGRGNFEVKLEEPSSNDEVGVVTSAFNQMVVSINDYIGKTKSSIERESRMKERELLMEGHLKDAQLKYLKAQINPHFLFNTLNAGAQLAMMEDAEKTCLFIENMAAFFRYNVKKLEEDANLEEEIQVVDHYIYILNVRFSNEIHYSKRVDPETLPARVPSMILQPIVENAVNYGIRDIEGEGTIRLSIESRRDRICISICDNGRGMTQEQIDAVMNGDPVQEGSNDSTGIGLRNVISRLRLYYGIRDVLEIRSQGLNRGTEVIIRIPRFKGG